MDNRDDKVLSLINRHRMYIIVALISTFLAWVTYFKDKNTIYLIAAISLLIATIVMIFNYKESTKAIKIKYGKKERK